METQQTSTSLGFEQMLLQILRTLHPRRAAQVVDFARWLQTQPALDEKLEAEISAEELEREEKAWEQTYLANRDNFREMARQALKDLDAGETLEMSMENGRVTAR
jgi:hypothetical protein